MLIGHGAQPRTSPLSVRACTLMSKPAGAGAHWPWNDWAVCQLPGAWEANAMPRGSMAFLCPELHCPPPLRASVTLMRILLAPCLLDSARQRKNHSYIWEPDQPQAWFGSHLLPSQILGKPITQWVSGEIGKTTWRELSRKLSLNPRIWYKLRWTQHPCFFPAAEIPPFDNSQLIISQRHDWMCDLENQNIHDALVSYLYRMWAITMTITIATITMYFLCARHHTKNFHCANF